MATCSLFSTSRTWQHSEIPRLRRRFVRASFSGSKCSCSRAHLARATLATDREECTPAFLPSFSSSLLFSPLSSPPFNDHIFEFPTWGARNKGQCTVVMLTKGNSGAVNELVTCICRSLAGIWSKMVLKLGFCKNSYLRFYENSDVRYAGVSKCISVSISLISWINT